MKKKVENNLDIKVLMVKSKLILVSPGGLKGFYSFGILNYLRNNYQMNQYIYSGASAGAWNCLLMCCNKDRFYVNNFVESLFEPIEKSKSIGEIQNIFKTKLLDNFSSSDFDFSRLYIGVTSLEDKNISTDVYTKFTDLSDAIDCCIASSHVPLVTGGLVNKYRGKFSFDGGFSNYPYLKIPNKKPLVHIRPGMWEKNTKHKVYELVEIVEGFSLEKNNMEQLYRKGFSDAEKNISYFKHLGLKRKY